MTVSAQEVAAELRARLPGIEKKKLQKLLYYCQGHHLAVLDRPMFEERISAWDMGPVVGALWHAENENGEGEAGHFVSDEGVLNTIGYVLSKYGRLSGGDLERLTHAEAPWQQANANRSEGGSAPIPVESLATFFRAEHRREEDEDELSPDHDDVYAWISGAAERMTHSVTPDSIDEVRARLRDSA